MLPRVQQLKILIVFIHGAQTCRIDNNTVAILNLSSLPQRGAAHVSKADTFVSKIQIVNKGLKGMDMAEAGHGITFNTQPAPGIFSRNMV